MTIKVRRVHGDDGATLVLVLILVTFIAMVLGVILDQADTSSRATVALSDQAASQYAADGAGQAAVTRLRRGTFPNLCATTGGDTLQLGSAGAPFYDSSASSNTTYNAAITCTPDNTSAGGGGVIGGGNKPGFALLTVGTAAAKVEDGQSYPKKDVPFANGDVISDSDIDGSGNIDLDAPYKIRAVACDKAPCVPIAAPGMADPNYAAPTAAVNPAPAPVCSADHAYVAFRPGLYSNANTLNSGCWNSNAVAWFSPGVYYFDFTTAGSHVWSVPNQVVGGTPMNKAATSAPIPGLNPAVGSTLSALSALHAAPGSCADPSVSNYPGVEFAFGGDSQVDLGTSDFEACASYSGSSVPIAVYGLKSDVTNGGSATAHGQSGCIVVPGNAGCDLIGNFGNGHLGLHLQGMLYAPKSRIELTYKNSNDGQALNWGAVLRSVALTLNGAAKPDNPVVQLPGDGQFGITGRSILYLDVYVCPATGTGCTASGTPDLRVKVQITSQTVPATLNILSWSYLS